VPEPTGLSEGLQAELEAVVGPAHVLTQPDVTASYAVDWTGRFVGSTPAVVRPADTAEVAGVLRVLAAAGVAVVPQGGNTGMVGGSVPLGGEVVLSLRRLDRIEPVDRLAAQVTAGAGAVLADLQRAAAAAGLEFGVDLGARDSCTVGGMVATNAGGLHVIRYGSMREQVVGIEAVLADGTVVSHLGGLLKDNTGYDLPRLLTGSEGTLAVVTRVRLRLRPALAHRVVAMCGCPSAAALVEAAARVRDGLPDITAMEMVLGHTVDLVSAYIGRRPPVDGDSLLLLEVRAAVDPTGAMANAVDGLADLVGGVAVATDDRGAADLFAFRERVTEAVNVGPPPHKLDVTLPATALADFAAAVPGVVDAVSPGALTYLFGHVGDGNVHVNVKPPPGGADLPDAVDAAVFELVGRMEGSISAEHGIGTAKKEWLHLSRSYDEIEVFRRIKGALDPTGILNPAVLLP
jgi:FAD/FMN-containing dehydrogenase